MKPFKDQPIARKALLLGLVPTITAIILVIASSMLATYVQSRNDLVLDLEAESSLLADNVGAGVAFNDKKSIGDTLTAYRAKTNIDAVCVFSSDGRLFASFERTPGLCSTRQTVLDPKTTIVREQPLVMGAKTVGMVRVSGNFSRLYAWTRRQALVGLGTFVVGVLLSLALTKQLSQDITGPLQHLAMTADGVSTSGDYGVRATKMTDDEVGRLVGSFNGMLEKIQQQHEASATLLEREQEASRLKDQFLAAVSHELRTPLNAILGWLQVIRTTRPGQKTMERALESLERNARAQARVVEDLIEISRVVTGKLQLRTETLDLRRVVRAALEVVDPTAKAKGVQVSPTLPDEPSLVFGDTDRLQQVMWNLFSNAVKFTPTGGTVAVDLAAANGEYVLTVSDTGIGITKEFMPFLFDRFRQADGSMTREHGGLGLGLAIARELTDLHGGSLSATSAGTGKGATFKLRLPRLDVVRPGTRDAPRAAQRRNLLEGVRVLAVDDDPDALEVIAEGLRTAGAEVKTAQSGAEAVELFERERFDVLVCDLAMPGMDGFGVIKNIRPKLRASSDLLAIALSAHTSELDRERTLAAGFKRHLGKPFDLRELIETIAAG